MSEPASERRAGDMVGKGSSTTELIIGSLSGFAFGLISPIAGQPFDVVKTKMQADSRFLTSGPLTVARQVIQSEGLIGMYRGMLPILASTGVQKTVLFTANAGARRTVESSKIPILTDPIPGTYGLRPSVLIGGVAASAARTVVETPFELMKVRMQTGGQIRSVSGVSMFSFTQLAELYTGAFPTFNRGAHSKPYNYDHAHALRSPHLYGDYAHLILRRWLCCRADISIAALVLTVCEPPRDCSNTDAGFLLRLLRLL